MEALEDVGRLKDHLLSSDVGPHIAKIILFGSSGKGTATGASDIDVMVMTANGRDVEKTMMDHVYDFMVDSGIPFEVMPAGVLDLYFPTDYFVYNVVHQGIEVFSMEKDQLKRSAAENLLSLSEEYLESAREVLVNNRIRLAVDAAYNAAELAAKALILLKQDDVPGSHGGVVALFGQLYVKENVIERELGRNLNMSLRLRNEARYKPGAVLSREDAESVLKTAERLMELASSLAKSAGT